MNQATEIYNSEFDSVFFDLPPRWRHAVDRAIRDLGSRLATFPHYRLQGRPEFRMRVGDYRVIYEFNLARNEVSLITLGHRRDIYR